MTEPSMNMSLAELEGLAGEAHAHGDLPRAAAAHTCAGALEVEAGRHDSGLEHFARAITAYEGCGQVREALVNVYNRAHTLFLAERYHQSLEEYQALEQRAQAIGAGVDMTRAVVGRWHVHQALGDTESAQATLEQVRVVAHEAQQLPTAGWADYQLGGLAYSQQQYDRAIAMYSSARATYTTLLMGERVAECDQALASHRSTRATARVPWPRLTGPESGTHCTGCRTGSPTVSATGLPCWVPDAYAARMNLLPVYVKGWRDAAADIIDATADLTDEEWARETDCPGWSVHDVLAHVAALEQFAAGLQESEPFGEGTLVTPEWTEISVRARRDRPSEALRGELAAAVSVRAQQLQELVADADPRGVPDRVPADLPWDWDTLLRNRAIDMWVHGQDIRNALDKPGHADSVGAAVTIQAFAAALPYVLGHKVRPPAGTTVVWELSGEHATTVAVEVEESGRARRLPETPADPTLHLSMGGDAFALLGAGRQAAATLKVAIVGPVGLAAEVFEAMAVTP